LQEKMVFWFCTLPADASLHTLVVLAHTRWVIEQFSEDATQECGLDHVQGRSWQGLHHEKRASAKRLCFRGHLAGLALLFLRTALSEGHSICVQF